MPRPAPLAALAFTTLCLAFAPSRAAAAGPRDGYALCALDRAAHAAAGRVAWRHLAGWDRGLRRAATGGCGWNDAVRAAELTAARRGTPLLSGTSRPAAPAAAAETAVRGVRLVWASSVTPVPATVRTAVRGTVLVAARSVAETIRRPLVAARSVEPGRRFSPRTPARVPAAGNRARGPVRTVELLTTVPARRPLVARKPVRIAPAAARTALVAPRPARSARRPLVAAKPVRADRNGAAPAWAAVAVEEARRIGRELRSAAVRSTVAAAVGGTRDGWRSLTAAADAWLRPSAGRVADAAGETTVR